MAGIRKALREDADRISSTLAECFADDPVVKLLLPGDSLRARYFRETFVDTFVVHGLCWITDGFEGVAMWLPPGAMEKEPSLSFGLAWALRVATRHGLCAFVRLQRMAAFVKACKPAGAHYYLHAVGVRKEFRGRGLAKALLEPALRRCDDTRTIAYLENSREENLPFYARLGFDVMDVLDPEKAGARIWIMTREPR